MGDVPVAIEGVQEERGIIEAETADGVAIGPRRTVCVIGNRVFTSRDEALDTLEAERER